MRLGRHQLDLMSGIAGTHSALVVPNKLTASLERRGLMKSASRTGNAFMVLTPAAYREIAAALEDGRIERGTVEEWSGARRRRLAI